MFVSQGINITNAVILLGDKNGVEDYNFCDFNTEYNLLEVILTMVMNLCASTYMKYPEQANPQRQKADQWLLVAGGQEQTDSDYLIGTRFLLR